METSTVSASHSVDNSSVNGSTAIIDDKNNQAAMRGKVLATDIEHMGSLYSLVAKGVSHYDFTRSFTLIKNVPIKKDTHIACNSSGGASFKEYDFSANFASYADAHDGRYINDSNSSYQCNKCIYFKSNAAPPVVNVHMAFKVIRLNAAIPYGKSEIRIYPGDGSSHLIAVDSKVVEHLKLRTVHESYKLELVKKLERKRKRKMFDEDTAYIKAFMVDRRSKKIAKRVRRASF
ncbi:hypothetical protein BZA77DRAFT_357095 [Pyronema omphalodes]|nr:hypothetical protein BZA77DRAFT_357095 [Pyronema omphalodes]